MTEEQTYRKPPLVPRWRSIYNALRLARNPIPFLEENVRDYGKTYAFHLGGFKKGIFSVEPEFIRHVLQKNHRNFRKSNMQTGILSQYIGRGLLTAEGDYWLRQRRLIQPGFRKDRIENLIHLMRDEIDRSVEISAQLSKNGPVDMYVQMHRLTFRIIVRTLFSTRFPEGEIETLSDNITRLQNMVVKQIRQPYFYQWFKLSGMIARHYNLALQSREMIMKRIRERRESGRKENDLLQMLLDARYPDTGKGMTEEQLLDECMILFVAGHETSANALSWAFYLLSQHPDVLIALRKEYDDMEEHTPGTMEELQKLRYTRMVLNEAMRIYPPAWVIDRQSLEDDVIAGFHIPANTFIVLLVYGVHHDPDTWPEPEKFDPDRFNPEKMNEHKPYSFIPFGGGPRLCIGNHFAMTEMQLVLKAFVQRFEFSLVPGQDISPLPLVTLRPKKGMLMVLRDPVGNA